MTAIITAGTAGATGTHVATGTTEVIASGSFAGNSVQITVVSDAQPEAPAHCFSGPGAVLIQSKSGTSVIATVTGVNTSSISVTTK